MLCLYSIVTVLFFLAVLMFFYLVVCGFFVIYIWCGVFILTKDMNKYCVLTLSGFALVAGFICAMQL
jgi:hypothetical protein